MATLAQHLTGVAQKWLQNRKVGLSADGEIELEALLAIAQTRATRNAAFAGGVAPTGNSELTQVEDHLEAILEKAVSLSGGGQIDGVTLQRARLTLCPLFPFC